MDLRDPRETMNKSLYEPFYLDTIAISRFRNQKSNKKSTLKGFFFIFK